MAPAATWYDEHAADAVEMYEGADPAALHAWLDGLLPTSSSLVADIGAGSGRDAAWFASLGHEVLAVEPSVAMRDEGMRLHADARIRWVADGLPSLAVTLRIGLAADVVHLGGVWQHVAPADRSRAFRKLVGLLRSGGLLAITLRHGPDDGRGMHPVSLDEVERLAREHGMAVVRVHHSPDAIDRPEVSWTSVALRLPDDGTGALPLLRHLILADQKSPPTSWACCVLCAGSPRVRRASLVRSGTDHVALPLGLVALNWVRQYLPWSAGLPQAPGNRGRGGPGLRPGQASWRRLPVPSRVPISASARGSGLMPGERCTPPCAKRPTSSPGCQPTYLTFPGGGRIFPVERGRANTSPGEVVLNEAYLVSFGPCWFPAACGGRCGDTPSGWSLPWWRNGYV